ncbi:AfsR/SARP family transcriptional regulator [Streptomyces diacarni]|uniref:Activator protein n=1 Tax=Streptomyces diacarni TaxID=2800381 RepID=A0A367EEJ3_9ACTN|nr:AfsR/SARP family transcriptional regulator [Streptomyces diacarni]RCG16189.1 activator protein [Streptomyces diacarni]
MRYELLGTLRVAEGDEVRTLGARKIETVLAVLLIRADQVVTFEQIMTEVWGDDLPRRATAGLHVYISQLRKFLSRPGHRENPVVTRTSGYTLRTDDDELDFRVFLDKVKQGRARVREEQHEEAVECFEEALRLWRGPVLGDLQNGPIADGFAAWLEETRLESVEVLGETQLQLGRHRELVGWLYSLTTEHPLRETFYRQLMLALYRSERQADALRVYQTARARLNEELGLEPCRALQSLHQSILTADARLDPQAQPVSA